MSPKQPSKQRRQSQNRQQRAALQARTEAAQAPKPTSAAGGSPEASSGSSDAGSGGSSSGAGTSGSLLSRLRGGGSATGPAPTTSSRATSAAKAPARSSSLPVGHRAALSALLAAIAGLLVGAALFKVPVDRAGDPIGSRETLVAEWTLSALDEAQSAPPSATASDVSAAVKDWLPGGTEPYVKAFWPISLAVLLPVIGAALGYRAVSRRSGSKAVNRCVYVTLFGALLTSQLLLIFLPAVISLGVAAYQVKKFEAVALAASGDPPAPGRKGAIEADVVEAEVVDDEPASE